MSTCTDSVGIGRDTNVDYLYTEYQLFINNIKKLSN